MTERKKRPTGDVAYIDESDRQRILDRMDEKGIKKAELARQCDVSGSAITLLLSKPIPKGKTRACRFMVKLQKALDMVITAKRPTTLPRGPAHRAEQVLKMLEERDPEELDRWLSDGEWRAQKLAEARRRQ